MNEWVKFVAAMLGADETFVELCERFGSRRKEGMSGRNDTSAEGLNRRVLATADGRS